MNLQLNDIELGQAAIIPVTTVSHGNTTELVKHEPTPLKLALANVNSEIGLRLKRIYIAIGVWCAAVLGTVSLSMWMAQPIIYLILPLPMVVFLMIMVSRKQTRAVEALIPFNDPSLIGPLLETLSSTNLSLRLKIFEKLVNVLPLVDDQRDGNLTRRQRGFLITMLKSPGLLMIDSELAQRLQVSIVESLPYTGDERAVPIVRRLAATRGDSELTKEARRILPIIVERLSVMRSTEGLLRASSRNDLPTQPLLRPALEPTDLMKDELLRPVGKNDEI